MIVKEAYRIWQNDYWRIEGNLLENTIRGYISIYNKHLLPIIGDCQIDNIDVQKLQEYYNSLANQGVKSKTIKNINQALEAMLRYFQQKKEISDIQVDTIVLPKLRGNNEIANPISEEEYVKLLPYLSGHYKWVVPFIAETGIRVEEIAIPLTCIDFENKLIHIQYAVKRKYTNFENKTTKLICSPYLKAEASYRTVPITPTVEIIINNQLQHLKNNNINSEFLFPNTNGEIIEPRNLLRYYHELLDKANLEHRGLSSLRKLFIKRMVLGGMQPKVLQKIVGHSEFSTTMKYYMIIDDNDKKQEALKVYENLRNSSINAYYDQLLCSTDS
ncbi:MAG: tyrosine-type recombinase/integrase [Acutalibacteraceae bacterium]|nr:tyrosine-type recombinase/integrase [Acutalibacteraceae bacterium]